MKTKRLLLMLLLALVVPWTANAQTALLEEDFNDMTSLATSYSATDWFAYNAGSGNNWTLNSSSGVSSSKCVQYNYNYYNDADCYLVSSPFTVNASLDVLNVSLYEKVRSATYAETFEVFFVKASDVTTDASVVSATHYAAIASASYTNTSYEEVTGTNNNDALAGQSVRLVVHCTSAANKWTLYIDDITVTETLATGCPKPKNLTATNITAESATLGWTTTENPSNGFNVRYRTAEVQNMYFFDDFETNTLSGWTIYTDGEAPQSNGWYTINPQNGLGFNAHSGSYCASAWSWSDYAYDADNWLITPEVPLTGTLRFYVRTNESYPDEYEVLLSTTGTAEANFNVTLQAMAAAPATGVWEEVSIDLSSYSGNGYIAIHHVSNNMNYLLIDDFGIYGDLTPAGAWTNTTSNTNSKDIDNLAENTLYDFEVQSNCGGELSDWIASTFRTNPSCMPVANLNVSNVTTTTVSLTWTDQNSGSASYIVTDVDNNPVTVTNLTATGCTVTGLTANTPYTFKVSADCGSTVETINVRTDCNALTTFPYEEGFEVTSTNIYCWDLDGFGRINNPDYSHTGNVSLYSQTTSVAYAILPATTPNISDLMLNFWWQNAYSGYDLGSLEVGYITDEANYSTFVTIGTIDMSSSSATYTQSIDYVFTGASAGARIALKYTTGTAGSLVIIDDVIIDEAPPCMKPTGLTVTAPTAHGATFSWTAGAANQTAWQLYFSTTNVAPTDDETNVIAATSNPFTLESGLNAETPYYVWVRANCGGTDGNSVWVGPETFTTEIACPAPTAFNVVPNSITGHTADLTWQGTSDSYVVSYRTAAYVDGTTEEFNSTSIPTGWAQYSGLLSEVIAGTTTLSSGSNWNFGTSNGVFNSHAKIEIWSTARKNWLVTPSHTLGSSSELSFDLALTYWSGTVGSPATTGTDDKFVVLITTDNMATWTILRQWDNDDNTTGDIYAIYNNITCSDKGEKVTIDLSTYAGQEVRIAFYGESTVSNADNNLHIDNVAIGTPVAAGEWQYKNVSEAPCELTGLLAERKYEATLQGDCGDEGPSTVVGPITFTTDIACPAPTTLTKSNLKSTQVDLSWVNGGAENWVVAYKETSSNDDFIEISIGTNDVTIEGTLVTYPLTGLTPETPYTVKVRDNCEATVTGDGLSEWTDPMNFTTLAACALDNVTVSGITHHNATVTWDGESASGFTVSYRTAAGENALYSEDFEDETSFDNWTFTSMNEANGINGEGTYPAGICADAAHNSSLGFRFSSFDQKTDSETYDQYLVSPELTVTGTLKFYAYRRDAGDYLYVGYSTTTSDLDAFTWDDEALGFNSNQSWQEFTHELPTNVKYIAFHYFGNYRYYVYVDDIAITVPNPAGTTQTVVVTENTANLNELTAGQEYEVWVEPNCDVTLASEPQTFTTLSANNKYFLTAGDWATASNWMDNEMPALTDDAIIKANAIITSDAAAKKITFQGSPTPTLTIADGGTLQTDNTVTATVKKNIEGYGDDGVNTNNGYYLIANPINTSYGSATTYGMVTSDGLYDLYQFNGNPSATDSLEWRNYKASTFSIANGKGYLYANKNDVELTFNGTVRANNARVGLTTNNEGQWQFKAWNLLGNPFVCDAYMVDNDGNALAYYKMNEDGNGLVSIANGASIAPMEGVFFKNSGSGYINVYFTREEPATRGQLLNINLYQANTRSNSRIDNAIIRFGEGNTLEKFSFRAGSSKVYIPMEDKDYAVVNAGNVGEMPVSFKAAENGSYTLGFTNEEVTFSYLHLIDNLTGNDVDLLANPSYSFDARTTDYASRFRLVFATGSSATDDSFGFINGMGNLCIFGIEGTATLQVMDVTGRIISSETFSGSYEKNLNVASGVYMLRLINGNDVKVQKMVVK